MRPKFRLKLIRRKEDEASLIVFVNTGSRVDQYYANVLSFERLQTIAAELRANRQKYFFKKDLLFVHELTEERLLEVVIELEETGDFYEIMRPVNLSNKAIFCWEGFKKFIFKTIGHERF
jgi:hypothetical protein